MKTGAAGLGLLALGGLGASPAAAASSQAADQMFASGTVFNEHTLDTKTDGNTSQDFSLLSGSIKTSTPTDLILMVQAETALWTNIKTTGKDEESQAKAGLTCWIEIDGVPVPVSMDYLDGSYTRQEASEIVFNKRDFKVQQNFLGALEDLTEEEVEYYLALFLNTQSSHGFNWVALNVDSEYVPADGGGFHTVELMGRLDVFRDDNNAYAKAVIGPRTMIGFPAKLGNSATM